MSESISNAQSLLVNDTPIDQPPTPSDVSAPGSRSRANSGATVGGRLRAASTKILDSNIPLGMWSATGTVAARAPSLADLRRNSQGSRRDSNTSLPRSATFPPSSPEASPSPVKTRPARTRTGSSGKLEKITGEDDDGGLPEGVFGRGELDDQSFVRGQRASQISTRVPKLAVRNRDTNAKEPEKPATKTKDPPIPTPGDPQSPNTAKIAESEESEESKEPFPDLEEEDDDDLEDLMPKPKRSSKNIDAMLGRSPTAPQVSGPGTQVMTPNRRLAGKRNGEASDAVLEYEDEDDDLDDLVPRPKRTSKNIDAMLGRTPDKTPSPPISEEEQDKEPAQPIPNEEGVYPNGYSFPPDKTWSEATVIGLKAFLRFTFTPLGFFIVLYGLNVVAWGGMLFLLLCNASPAMCQLGNGIYDCNNIDSPRRVWVEIDSQILNSLFCVTGFGLIPWRFRDFYYLLMWRVWKREKGLRKLAGYHNGWFRLPGSDRLPLRSYNESQMWEDESNSALPIPLKRAPAPPLTGARSPPTALWKMDFVIWAFVWNTFLQACLSGFMWGLNRYDRPSWSTGLFVALACVVAGLGGLMQFFEGKKIKRVEGIPLDTEMTIEDVEGGGQSRQTLEKRRTLSEGDKNEAKGKEKEESGREEK